MPISPLVLQRRHAELGRIRLGQKEPTASGKTRPAKLATFRFTSPSRELIAGIADLYGGTARPWDNAGKPEHEVITDATSVPVIVVKGGMSQWMETWSGGGCTHRCDGVTNVVTGDLCDPDDPAHRDAKPTTRLSVMLRDVESLGVWRLESHGWNAAAELPMLAELAMHVGDLVPATLHLVERKVLRDGHTSRFVVPQLDLAVSKQRLVEIAAASSGSLGAICAPEPVGQAALPAGPVQVPAPDYTAAIGAAGSLEELRDVWNRAAAAGHMTPDLQAELTDRSEKLREEDTVAEAEVVGQAQAGDVDAVWLALMATASTAGWTEPQLREQLITWSGGQPVEDLTAEQLAAFAEALGAVA